MDIILMVLITVLGLAIGLPLWFSLMVAASIVETSKVITKVWEALEQ